MKTTKPDRFQRMVEETLHGYLANNDILTENRVVKAGDVVKLLRQEHRAVAGWAKKSPKYGCWDTAYRDGYNDCVKELRAWLTRRAK